MKKYLIFLFVVIPLLAAVAGGTYLSLKFYKSYTGPDVTFTVHSGEPFARINHRLYKEGLISDQRLFHYYAKYKNVLTKFRAGSFTITKGSHLGQVLDTLVYGQPNLTSITIPEGKNMYEIAKLFEVSGITSEAEFLEAVQNPGVIARLSINAKSLEGYLYPETYLFAPNTPAKSVVKSMIDLFNERTKDIDFSHPFLNKHQVIILASVVEKETGAKVERPTIAGVFTNRLERKMRLQSDPTTIYGIWSRYKGNIRKSDLLEVTPYNTYKIPALPEGPISNPSLEAIKAVLNPEKHDYLFFVSKNDGTHIFSENYKKHNQAVEEYQKNPRARKGKSWRDLKQ